MTNEEIKKGLSAINLMLAYDEEHSPEQYAVHKEVLENARACVEQLEKIENEMIKEIEQIHRDWFKEYDSATAYTKLSEFIHKYTKE